MNETGSRHCLTVHDYDDPSFRLDLTASGLGMIRCTSQDDGWSGNYFLLQLDQPYGEYKQLLVSPRHAGDSSELCANGQCWVGIGGLKNGLQLTAKDLFRPESVDYFAIGNIKKIDN